MRIPPYLQLMRLHSPIGIFLLLWPTLWGLWIASTGQPSSRLLFIFIIGVIIMRSAGCILNDLADQRFDSYVTRTRNRPLVTGLVTRAAAKWLCCVLLLFALLLVLQLNRLTQLLSLMALGLAAIYPFMKRYTYWPQLVLGAAFACSVLMAFTAQTGHLPALAWLIYVIAVLWPLAYDTMYAMADSREDQTIGIKSTALLFGRHVQKAIAIMQGLVLCGLLLLGIYLHFPYAYYMAWLLALILAGYQQYLLQQPESACWVKAFKLSSWFGLIIFIGIALSYK